MSFEHIRYSESAIFKSFDLIYPSMILDVNQKPIYLNVEKQVDTIFKALADYDLTLGVISREMLFCGGGTSFKCRKGAEVDFDKTFSENETPLANLLTIYYDFFELNLHDALTKLLLKHNPEASDEFKYDFIGENDWGFMRFDPDKKVFFFEFNSYLIDRHFKGFSSEHFKASLHDRFKDEIEALKAKTSPFYAVSERAFKNSKKRFQSVLSEEFGVDVRPAKANELLGKIIFNASSSAEIKPAIKSALNI